MTAPTANATIELCDGAFNKLHELETGELTAVTRLNEPGEWRVDFQLDEVPRETLLGVATVLVRDESRVMFAGYRFGTGGGLAGLGGIEMRISNDGRRGSVEGLDTWYWLTSRLVFPDPAAEEPWSVEADVRSGMGGTVLAGFVEDNVGPSALTDRQFAGLTVAAAAVGAIGEWSGRLEPLAELATRIAKESGIVVYPTLTNIAERLPIVRIRAASDRSAEMVVADIADLADAEARVVNATATWVLAAGSGEGAARMFRSSDGGFSGINRREMLVEAANSTTSNELYQVANATRVENSFALYVSGRTNALAAEQYRYLTDYELGDLVTVQVSGLRFVVPITAIELAVTPGRVVETPVLGTYTPNRLKGMQEAILLLERRNDTNIA
jgi:hypothetical protein